jgi:predicted nucleic acid-binding Zn ribbon protein
MDSAAQLLCDECGELADVIQNEQIDPLGKVIRWPKAAGIYLAINCPKCGERYQRVAKRPNNPPD